jgi:hypothetical protein
MKTMKNEYVSIELEVVEIKDDIITQSNPDSDGFFGFNMGLPTVNLGNNNDNNNG